MERDLWHCEFGESIAWFVCFNVAVDAVVYVLEKKVVASDGSDTRTFGGAGRRATRRDQHDGPCT
jgi:hypothetical protein